MVSGFYYVQFMVSAPHYTGAQKYCVFFQSTATHPSPTYRCKISLKFLMQCKCTVTPIGQTFSVQSQPSAGDVAVAKFRKFFTSTQERGLKQVLPQEHGIETLRPFMTDRPTDQLTVRWTSRVIGNFDFQLLRYGRLMIWTYEGHFLCCLYICQEVLLLGVACKL